MDTEKLISGIGTAKYIKTKLRQNRAASYADWLKSYGTDTARERATAERAAAESYTRADTGYGRRAEALAGAGMSYSGYRDYLQGVAHSDMQRAMTAARSAAAEGERKNAASYADYIASYNKNQSKLASDAVKHLTSERMVDPMTAYQYALTLGLSEENAAYAAKEGTRAARESIIRYLMEQMNKTKLTKSEAMNYARSLGLGDEDIKRIEAGAPYREKHYYDESGKEITYLEYLKKKLEDMKNGKN